MRAIIFFDLPRDTSKQRKVATRFVKDLKKDGFIMLQESVYCKLFLNATGVDLVKNRIEKYKPKEGVVTMLVITEKQFGDMIYFTGAAPNKVVNSTDRIIRL